MVEHVCRVDNPVSLKSYILLNTSLIIQLSVFQWRELSPYAKCSNSKIVVHAFHFHLEKYSAAGSNIFLVIKCQLILDFSFKDVQSIWCSLLAVYPQLFSRWDGLRYAHLSIHWQWIHAYFALLVVYCRWFPCNTATLSISIWMLQRFLKYCCFKCEGKGYVFACNLAKKTSNVMLHLMFKVSGIVDLLKNGLEALYI